MADFAQTDSIAAVTAPSPAAASLLATIGVRVCASISPVESTRPAATLVPPMSTPITKPSCTGTSFIPHYQYPPIAPGHIQVCNLTACQNILLDIPRTKMAATSTATPRPINRSGCLPAPLHSPVAMPQTVAVMTMSDINSGQPSTGPNSPSSVAPTPYSTVLPNQKNAMMAANPQ